jgi:hypothetical protein
MGIKTRRLCLTQKWPGFRFGPARYPTPSGPGGVPIGRRGETKGPERNRFVRP